MSVYAVADLHGRYDLFEQIKNFLKPEDTVYVLGDCGDRGPDGWKIITEVMENPQFIYIKGNHEQLLEEAIKAYSKSDEEPTAFFAYDPDYALYRYNGGEKTFRDWGRQTRHSYSWIKRLHDLPEHLTYVNQDGLKIELSHAGFTPGSNDIDYLWDRNHYQNFHPWPARFNDTIIVHGHTPVPHLMDDIGDDNATEPGAYWYSNNHKVCIDCGSVFTGHTVLLNLDTFDEEIFEGEDYIYGDDH